MFDHARLYGARREERPVSVVALIDELHEHGLLSARQTNSGIALDTEDRIRLTEILRAAR